MPVVEPVTIDTHVPEVSGVPPDAAASHFQARPDSLQFYHLLREQRQSREQQQFAHRATSILLVELRNFEVPAQRSAESFLENTDAGKATSASFQDVNLGLLVQAGWQLGGSTLEFVMTR